MHKWKLYTTMDTLFIEAERVFVEEGALHIVHGKDEAVSIHPENKWTRCEYIEEVKNAPRKRPTKNSKT